MLLPRLLALGLLTGLLFPGTARAHNQSTGFSRVTVEGNSVRVSTWLLAADYQHLVGLDPDENGVITPDEARQGEAAVGVYLGQTLRVFATGEDGRQRACTPRFDGLDLDAAEGLPRRYPAHLAYACPVTPKRLVFRFGLFAGAPVRHQHLMVCTLADGRTEELLFTPEHSERVLTGVSRTGWEVARDFGALGVEHIVTGWDHLLFLVALLVAALRFRDVVALVTSFTVAHSITLAVAALGVFSLPARVVEPAIAASIVYLALDDARMLVRGRAPAVPRVAVSFAFGLVHGFGFAAALAETGLPRTHLVGALASFNVGVECGQLVFCAGVFALLQRVRRTAAGVRVGLGISVVAAALGGYWLVQRLWGT
ncbi:MAG: HupE/UreJ family protein [Deltaproteobacteria bacterium]|nr:HupE/UreJ family protein [Deltaproteobacteria bacterium]